MMTKQTKLLLAIALQIVIIFAIIIFKLSVLTGGNDVLLRIVPIDPRDLFRGDYITFQYDISNIDSHYYSGQQIKNGETVYIILRQSGKYWAAQRVQKTKPTENDLFIKGKVESGGGESQTDQFPDKRFSNSRLHIVYGIEQYFIPEGKGRNFTFRNREASARVAVNDNGDAALKQIYVDDKPFTTVLDEDAKKINNLITSNQNAGNEQQSNSIASNQNTGNEQQSINIASNRNTGNEQRRDSYGKENCEFPGLNLPGSYAIFAAGAYSGRKIDYQIDQSGHQATRMDVAVNYSSKPVVLMLGAYEPTIWNISWSPATRIAAVLVSGYHRQAVAGLDAAVPVMNTSYDNKGPCGYFYVVENDLEKLNPMSRRFFGRSVDLVYLAKNGGIVIGDAIPTGLRLITSKSSQPESFYDKTAPVAGQAGLEDAVQKGLLRKATDADFDAWVNAVDSNTHRRDVPLIAGQGRVKFRRPMNYNAYVVLKPFTYPAGLYGSNMAIFFIPRGVPQPQGNQGHSNVYDFNLLKCKGPDPECNH